MTRFVLSSKIRGATSVYANFKFRYWELQLECGHTVERRVKHKPREPGAPKLRGFAAMHAGRRPDEVLPAPGYVRRCEYCK